MHKSPRPGARGGPTVQEKLSVKWEKYFYFYYYYYYFYYSYLLILLQRWSYCAGEGLCV